MRVFDRVIGRVAGEGPRLHARWNAERFAAIGEGPCRVLWERLAEAPSPDDEATFSAYATLLREALGAGYLGRRADAEGEDRAPWANLLENCLLDLVPRSLPGVPAERRLALLARTWNLGEGLIDAPAWIDRYVSAFASELHDLEELERFLIRVLEPALGAGPPRTWRGGFAVTVLDTRPVHDAFLPGEMHLAAPTVLCVQDRRQPEAHLGVLLRPGQQSRIMGIFPALEPFREEETLPEITLETDRVRLGGLEVELPLLGRPHRTVVAGAGFFVASAADSQRLWVVESR